MALLEVRLPGFDHDLNNSGGAIVMGVSNSFTGAQYIPVAKIYGASDEGLGFDISSQGLSDGWAAFSMAHVTRQTAGQPLFTLSGATSDLFRVVAVDTNLGGTGTQKAQYWDGSAWQDVASLSSALADSAMHRIDVHWNIADSGGEFTVYVGGASEASFSGDTLRTADTAVNTISLQALYDHDFYTTSYGPLLIADADTRGMVLASGLPSSNGAHTEFINGEPEVDDIPYTAGYANDYATGDADGERMTLNIANISGTFAGYSVRAVALVFAAQPQAEPGLFLKPLVRVSSTDYNPSGSVQPTSADDTDYYGFVMLNDPSTGSPWADQAAVEACELGVILSSTA